MKKNKLMIVKMRVFIFGKRARGEKFKTSPGQTKKTIYPDNQPEIFEWMKEYRVGVLIKNYPVHIEL